MELNNKLRSLRTAKGVTQEQLAAELAAELFARSEKEAAEKYE